MEKTIYILPKRARLVCLFALILLPFFAELTAQCNPTNPFTVGEITGGTDVGQSFLTNSLCGNGSITDITVWATGSHSDATLYIYQGAGCGGTQLYAQPAVIGGSGMGTPTTIDVNPDVPFTAGQTYTFRFIIPGTGGSFLTLLRTTASTYPDGQFYLACIANSGIDLFFTVATNSLPLPVELVSFDARLLENQTHLTWRTDSEKDNAGFEIERSGNGEDWKMLNFVSGNGTTSKPHEYFFTDENPLPGDNYYRLKQLDFSGNTEYSDARHVRLASEKLEDVLVSPNPVQPGQTLIAHLGGASIESAQVVDMLGKIVWEGKQFEGERLEISLPPDLSKGFCWLVLEGGGERVVRKLLIQ